MRRALELAWRGWGRVSPNPMVGAVVLRGDETVAEGWHAEFGGPHAELAALLAAGDKARGATLVVTLEPCAHHGKTPPCTDAIRAAGIRRVVAAVRDPDPEARGGVEVLKRAGIETQIGLLAEEASVRRAQARHFHRRPDRGRGRPLAVDLRSRGARPRPLAAGGVRRDRRRRHDGVDRQPAADGARWAHAAQTARPHRVRPARHAQPRRVAGADGA